MRKFCAAQGFKDSEGAGKEGSVRGPFLKVHQIQSREEVKTVKGHWKRLAAVLVLLLLVIGAVVYAQSGKVTTQAPSKSEALAQADHGSDHGHAEGSEACQARHASGECKGHQAGEKGHSDGTADGGHEGSKACKGHEAGEKGHTK